jgi:hypothetical protein
MTANDVYVRALAQLDEIDDDGEANASTGYEGKAPLIIDAIQRECAKLAGVNVLTPITSFSSTLYVSDDIALRVMPYGVAAEFALQDKMEDEYNRNVMLYERAKQLVKPPMMRYDPYNTLSGMQ